MLKSELIKENKNLLIQNGQLMYLLEFGELRVEDSNHQIIWKRDSNARILQERIDKARKYLKDREEDNECCSVCSVMSDRLIDILGEKE